MKIRKKLMLVVVLLTVFTSAIISIVSYVNSNRLAADLTNLTLSLKLQGDLQATKVYESRYYGEIQLIDSHLVDQEGNPIEGNYTMVDAIKDDLNVVSTIFVREGNDFRRISTNIINKDGLRAVGTFLGTDSAAYQKVMQGETYVGKANILGLPYLTGYQAIIDKQKNVIGIRFIGIPISEIDVIIKNGMSDFIQNLSIALLVLFFLSIISSVLISRSITKPLVQTITILKDISEGEGDLTRKIEVKSHDEVSDMAKYFNLTFDKIRNLVALVRSQSNSLLILGENLSSNMTETATAINEITANIQSIKNQTLSQSASVTETSATMEQISKGIDKLNQLILDQSANVTESSSAIEEMMANIGSVTTTLVKNSENIKQLTFSSEAGRKVLDIITLAIKDVAKESDGLMEIGQIIQNIASQTNLLSMNAAIEAAHAGDSGRGFAVVADEIRKLAESSSTQTKTIGTVLKRIKDSIVKIIKYSEDVATKFNTIENEVKIVTEQEDGIRRAMEEQNEGSKQVLEAISILNDITQKVQASSIEMLTGSKQVSKEAVNMNMITQEITGGMNEMASGAEQMTVAVNAVNELSLENKVSIDSLINEVNKFKI